MQNINETIKRVKQNAVAKIRGVVKDAHKLKEKLREIRKETKREIHHIETNQLAKMLLGSFGFEVRLLTPEYGELYLDSAKKLPRVRQSLGVPLKLSGEKTVVNRSKTKIWVGLVTKEFPGLRIYYKATLTKNSRCRIISNRQSYSSRRLVCEI